MIFSGSLPATRLAVAGFDPLFLTAARAVIAGLVAAGLLLLFRAKRPARGDLVSLALVALGVVLGFPLLTGLALHYVTSAHSIVFMGLLPLTTAVFAVLRGGERPHAAFWVFAELGSLVVAGFALAQSGVGSSKGDLFMLAAILICGLGYAEGGKLARRLGGWQVICWALVFSLPIMAVLALATLPASLNDIGRPAFAGLAYVSLFSMLIGFFFWYRGLALGGIAAVGQVQLLQPFFGFGLAAGLLHEAVGWPMLAASSVVMVCVGAAKRFAN